MKGKKTERKGKTIQVCTSSTRGLLKQFSTALPESLTASRSGTSFSSDVLLTRQRRTEEENTAEREEGEEEKKRRREMAGAGAGG